jgi:hypothetical protein
MGEVLPMSTILMIKKPAFYLDQRVRFIGGEGIVRSYKPDAENWMYVIAMALGPEPNFGRIGFETTILLNESDIYL